MKQSITTALLLVVFALSAVSTVVLSTRYFLSMKELERVRYRYGQIQNMRGAMQALAADCAEYSRQNPSLDAALAEFKSRPGATNAPAAPKPSR